MKKYSLLNFKYWLIIGILITAFIFSFLGILGFSILNPSLSPQVLAEKNIASSLMKTTDIDSQVKSFNLSGYSAQNPKKLYNVVIFYCFSGENKTVSNTYSQFNNDSYYDILNNAYNKSMYSVRNYYKAVSNGRLDLETVYLFENYSSLSPFQSSYNRGHFTKYSSSNPGGYKIDNSDQFQKEWGNKVTSTISSGNLPKTYSGASVPLSDLDQNNDNSLDALALILTENTNYVLQDEIGWADVLWPHQSINRYVTNSFFASAKYNLCVPQPTIEYTNVVSTTPADGILCISNSTFAHELGHILNLPDYYVYDNYPTAMRDTSVSPLSIYDLMDSNIFSQPQYFLSYNRLKLGFIDESNIVDINANGEYTLLPVAYEEQMGANLTNRPIAYRVSNPKYPNQYFYIEYHQNDYGNFDSAQLNSGLIIYRVDENVTAASDRGGMLNPGNFSASPYSLYLFRNQLDVTNLQYQASQYVAGVRGNDILGSSSYFANLSLSPVLKAGMQMGKNDGDSHQFTSVPLANLGGTTYTYNYKSNDITYQIVDENYIQSTGEYFYQDRIPTANVSTLNTGMVVNVTSIRNGELTFSLEWDENFDQGEIVDTPTEVTLSELGNNAILYNKLLDQATPVPGGEDNKLYTTSFKNLTSLSLINCKLTNLNFLTKFVITNITSLDLAGNLFTFDQAQIEELYQIQQKLMQLRTINLIFNNIPYDVFTVVNRMLSSYGVTLIYGIQGNGGSEIYYNQTNLKQSYLWNNSVTPYLNFYINGINQSSVSTNLQNYDIHPGQSITFEFAGKSGQPFNGVTYTKSITNVLIGTNYNSSNPLILWSDNNPFTQSYVKSIINVSGYGFNIDSFTYIFTVPDISESLTDYNDKLTVEIFYNDEKVSSLDIYYLVKVYYMPTVDIIGVDENGFMYQGLGSSYVEKGIIIKENGLVKNYTRKDNYLASDTRVYAIKYYNASKIGGVITKGMQVSSIQTNNTGYYIVEYTVLDYKSNSTVYQRKIEIVNDLIQESDVDAKLYQKLLAISGEAGLRQDFMENMDLVDLCGSELTSVRGLELFDFKQSVKIDLSKNNISDLSTIKTLLSAKSQISMIILNFNKVSKISIDLLETSYKNFIIFGAQEFEDYIIRVNSPSANKYMTLIGDYASFYNVSIVGITQSYADDILTLKEYGKFTIKFFAKAGTGLSNTEKTISYFNVLNIKQIAPVEYNKTYAYTTDELFTFEGINPSVFNNVTNDIDTLDLTTKGEQIVNYHFAIDEEDIFVMSQTLEVVDKTNPTITIDEKDIYLKVGEVFDGGNFSAFDDYDKDLTNNVRFIIKNAPNPITAGEYIIQYFVQDESGNTAIAERKIIYGEVNLIRLQENQNLNAGFFLPLQFLVFKQADFNIFYSLNGEERIRYTPSVGISINRIGTYNIQIYLNHKIQTDLEYTNLIYTVTVKDLVAPKITLDKTKIFVYLGQGYEDAGFYATDNSFTGTLTESSEEFGFEFKKEIFKADENKEYILPVDSITTDKLSSFKIIYTAIDMSGNIATRERYIQVIYQAIKDLKIDDSKILTSYEKGQDLKLSIKLPEGFDLNYIPEISWWINGELIKKDFSLVYDCILQSKGINTIMATVTNINNNGEEEVIQSQVLKVNIYESPSYTKDILIAGGVALAVAIVLCVILFVRKYKRRNFY